MLLGAGTGTVFLTDRTSHIGCSDIRSDVLGTRGSRHTQRHESFQPLSSAESPCAPGAGAGCGRRGMVVAQQDAVGWQEGTVPAEAGLSCGLSLAGRPSAETPPPARQCWGRDNSASDRPFFAAYEQKLPSLNTLGRRPVFYSRSEEMLVVCHTPRAAERL